MNISKSDPLQPYSPPVLYLTQKISLWIGHVWSICILPYKWIKHVVQTALACFSKMPEQAPPFTPPATHNSKIPLDTPIASATQSPKKFTKQQLQEKMTENRMNATVDQEEPVPDLHDLFYGDQEEVSKTPLPASTQKSDLKLEPTNPTISSPVSLLNSQAAPILQGETPHDQPVDAKVKNLQLANVKVTEEPSLKFTRSRRQVKKPVHLTQPALQPTPISVHSTLPALKPASQSIDSQLKPSQLQQTAHKAVEETKPKYIDAGGGGNCQLLSILKGLEKQYPEILKQYKDLHKQTLDAQVLRKMGVVFIREQLEKRGPYVEDLIGYLDTDRKEYNQAMIEPVERSLNEEKNKIEAKFQNKTISQAIYIKTKQAHREKFMTKITQLKKKYVRTNNDFLNLLEKNGFQCSTLHLFALSIKLELPIHVHDQYGVENHDIQYFNPTNSTKDPIHLYRKANMHYQYMEFSK